MQRVCRLAHCIIPASHRKTHLLSKRRGQYTGEFKGRVEMGTMINEWIKDFFKIAVNEARSKTLWQPKKLKHDGLVCSQSSSSWCGFSSETFYWLLHHERMRWLWDAGMYFWPRYERWQAFFLPWEGENGGQDLVIWFSDKGRRTASALRACWITTSRLTNSTIAWLDSS